MPLRSWNRRLRGPLGLCLPALLGLVLLLVPAAAQASRHGGAHGHRHGAHAMRSGHASAARRLKHRRRGTRAHRRSVHRHHRHAAGEQPQPAPGSPTGSGASGSGSAPSAPVPGVPSGETPEAHGGGASRSAPAVSVSCDLFASPSGSDAHGNGSVENPYQSVTKLDGALAPGQTGCLRGGTYGSTSTKHQLNHNGTAAGQITITAYPGESVTLVGWVVMEASHTTLAGLHIDGSNTFYKKTSSSGCQTPTVVGQALAITGSNDVFERNDYYESVAGLRGVGIGVGFWGNADNTTIRFNRIHDVGQCLQFDHLIYLASGNNVQIYDNWLYNDHYGWGVTVYPHPTNARIFSNVIDNAGSGINVGDNGSSASAGNQAWHNVVTDSFRVTGSSGHLLAAALVMCPGLDSASLGNEVVENDSFGNPDGIAAVSRSVGSANLSMSGNITADPRYIDPAAGDFDVAAGSPVASWELWNGS